MNGIGDIRLWNAGRLACVYSRPAQSSSGGGGGGEGEYSVHSVDSLCVHAASRTLVLSRQGRDLELYAFAHEAPWLRLRRELCGDPDELLDLLFLRPLPLLKATKQKKQRESAAKREYVLAATNSSSVRVLDAHSLDSRLFAAHSDTVLSLALHPSHSLLATTSKVQFTCRLQYSSYLLVPPLISMRSMLHKLVRVVVT